MLADAVRRLDPLTFKESEGDEGSESSLMLLLLLIFSPTDITRSADCSPLSCVFLSLPPSPSVAVHVLLSSLDSPCFLALRPFASRSSLLGNNLLLVSQPTLRLFLADCCCLVSRSLIG